MAITKFLTEIGREGRREREIKYCKMCNSHSTPFKWYRIVPFFSFTKSFILPLEQNLNKVRDLFSKLGHILRFLVDMISWGDTVQLTTAAKMV